MNQPLHVLQYVSRKIIASKAIILLVTFFIAFTNFTAQGQSMGISSTSITPDASSILELRTTSKGLLTPRMTTTQRDAISSPATGLVIYNTSTNQFNFYNGTIWTALATGSSAVNSVTGTTNRISIGGTSTDPTIDISSNYVGQTSITTLGTITAGIWNGSALTSTYLPSATVYNNQANTYNAGMKQSFQANASNAAINIAGISSDPSSLSNGDIWHNSTANNLKYRANGTTRTIANLDEVQTFTNKDLSSATNTFPTFNQNTTGTASKATNLVGGNSTTLLGSIPYQSNTDATTMLSPNTTSTKKFLTQTGTGTNGAVPSWSVLSSSDVGLGNVENTALSTWVGSTNLTTLGTIGSGTWNGSLINPTYGGTGVNNGTKTITLGGNLTTSGAFATTLTTTGTTNITLPTSGILATTSNDLSVFASTTSSQLAGVLSDETGTGSAVFSASPTFTGTPTLPTGTIATTQAFGDASTKIATTAFVDAALPNFARVTGSNATTTGTTLTNITGLSVALAANTVYEFYASLSVASSSTAGTKYGVNFSTAGATVEATYIGASSATSTVAGRISALNTATGVLMAVAADGAIHISGVITTGANAGNLTIQHLKVTSGTSTVYINSYLKAVKIQ
jgi:hypothetical protein